MVVDTFEILLYVADHISANSLSEGDQNNKKSQRIQPAPTENE